SSAARRSACAVNAVLTEGLKMRQAIRFAIVSIVFFGVMACAGMRQYPLGIPSSAAPQFFPAMEVAGTNHAMTVSKHPDSLHLRTPEGDWLQYMIKGSQIDLVILPETTGLTDEQIASRQAKLKALSDQLIAEAQGTAERAKSFQ